MVLQNCLINSNVVREGRNLKHETNHEHKNNLSENERGQKDILIFEEFQSLTKYERVDDMS